MSESSNASADSSCASRSVHYSALVLSRTSDGIECPATASLRPDSVTIEFWAFTDEFKRKNPIFVSLTNDNWDCGYGILGKEPGEFLVFHSNLADDSAVDRVKFNDEEKQARAGKWVHYCGTCDGSKLKFYINGELAVESSVPSEKGGKIKYGDEPDKLTLRIGNRKWGRSPFGFVGKIADVRIWNYAKKESQIAKYKQGLPLDSHSRRGLVLHYTFDPGDAGVIEGAGSIVHDLSGNGNDGTIVGKARCENLESPPNPMAPFAPAGSLLACCHAVIASTLRKTPKKSQRTRTNASTAGATSTSHAPTFSQSNSGSSFIMSNPAVITSSGGGGGAAKVLFRSYHILRDERVPLDESIKFSIDALTFRLAAPAKLDTKYEETFSIVNQSVSRVTVELPKKLQSHRYILSFEPALVNVRAGSTSDVKASITFLCTTIVEDEIYAAVFQDYAKKTGSAGLFGKKRGDDDVLPDSVKPLRIVMQSELTTRLDFMELIHEEAPIGEGSFGVVYRGEWRTTPVAIKELKVKFMKKQELDEFHREVGIMEKLRSPYIVNFVGAVLTEQHLSIVTEFMKHGSVKSALNKARKKKSDKIHNPSVKLRIALDAAHGLAFLHGNNIIHRDVKNDNLLIVSLSHHSPVTVKLTDFGTSRSSSMAIHVEMTAGVGTPAFMAPEILDSKPYSKSADVYSFGILMYELWTEKTPYSTSGFTKPWEIAHFVIEGKRLPIPPGMPESYAKVMEKCWDGNPAKRPTFDEVVKDLQAAVDASRGK